MTPAAGLPLLLGAEASLAAVLAIRRSDKVLLACALLLVIRAAVDLLAALRGWPTPIIDMQVFAHAAALIGLIVAALATARIYPLPLAASALLSLLTLVLAGSNLLQPAQAVQPMLSAWDLVAVIALAVGCRTRAGAPADA